MSPAQWAAFRPSYLHGRTTCPEYGQLGDATLRPTVHTVRFGCGHELKLPDRTDLSFAPATADQ